MTTNDGRAAFAKLALDAFAEATGSDGDEGYGDLICDLLHLAHRSGVDPIEAVKNGLRHWVCEMIDPPDGWSHVADIEIQMWVRPYLIGKQDDWKAWEPPPAKKRGKARPIRRRSAA